MSERPTQEVLDEAEWQEIGRCGCLIPDDDSDTTQDTEPEE